MVESNHRKPFALANWKMAMTIEEGKGFITSFLDRVGALADRVQIVLCPPYTALHALSTAIGPSSPRTGGTESLGRVGNHAHRRDLSPAFG